MTISYFLLSSKNQWFKPILPIFLQLIIMPADNSDDLFAQKLFTSIMNAFNDLI